MEAWEGAGREACATPLSLDPLPLRSRAGSAGVGLAKSARLVRFAEWRALGGQEGKSLNLSGLTSVMQLVPAHLSHET